MEGIKKAMNKRNLNEGQWEDRKQWSLGVRKHRKMFWNWYIHTLFNQTSNFHVQSQKTKSTAKANSWHEFIEMFSGRQPHQDEKVLQRFRDWLCPHLQSTADGFEEPKLITRCTTAWEHFTEFCCQESFKTYILAWSSIASSQKCPLTIDMSIHI